MPTIPTEKQAPFIRVLYRSILGREPESDAVVGPWTAYLAAHGPNVTARAIARSVEGRARLRGLLVPTVFRHVLGREPEAEAAASLAASGMALEDLLGGLHASEEFISKFLSGDEGEAPLPPPPPL